MRDWTTISAFDRLDLSESFILSWLADNGDLLFEVDFALAEGHPDYCQPRLGERACFRRGTLRFPNVRSMARLPSMAEVRPAFDATGEIDYGHFDSFVEVASDWSPINQLRPSILTSDFQFPIADSSECLQRVREPSLTDGARCFVLNDRIRGEHPALVGQELS
ncbi:MAG TPA: hypothetical protein VNH21_08655 [Steroidobacteraceae bacterium]|nr:hypothetical protein [Steroidobacteraceae bacterium]